MKNGFLGSNEYNGRDIHRVALGRATSYRNFVILSLSTNALLVKVFGFEVGWSTTLGERELGAPQYRTH
jgi:hypothetical protein